MLMSRLSIEGLTGAATIIAFGTAALSMMQDKSIEWLQNIFGSHVRGSAAILLFIILIYATPAFLLLALVNYLVNSAFNSEAPDSLGGKIKKGVNGAHWLVSLVPIAIGGAAIAALMWLTQRAEKTAGNESAAYKTLSIFADYRNVSNITGVMVYASFERGMIGEIARIILTSMLLLYIPLILFALIWVVRRIMQPKKTLTESPAKTRSSE